MAKAVKEQLKVVEFRAENIKKIKAVSIRPDGKNVVLLTGKNKQGKTSILDAIWMALGGTTTIPSKPIREGAETGYTFLDLGDFTVTRRFTEKGSYLEVKNKEGFKASSPQTFLDTKLGERASNPLQFMNLRGEEQVKALQRMVNIELDLAHLEAISGLPATKIKDASDPVKILDDAHKHIYDKRTEVNKEVQRLGGVIKSIEIPAGKEDVQPVSVKELFQKRKELEEQQKDNDLFRKGITELGTTIKDKEKEAKKTEGDIKRLEEELKVLRINLKAIDQEITSLSTEYDEKMIQDFKDPDFTEIDAQIAAADETNSLATKVQEKAKAEQDHASAKTKSDEMTNTLSLIKQYKQELIEKAGLPVPGLGFENGEVYYNGQPLSQASGAEQIQISCAICAAEHPEISLLTIDIGWSELDSEGRQALRDFADQTNTLIICSKVTDEPENEGFFIEDGEVVAIDGQPILKEEELKEANNG